MPRQLGRITVLFYPQNGQRGAYWRFSYLHLFYDHGVQNVADGKDGFFLAAGGFTVFFGMIPQIAHALLPTYWLYSHTDLRTLNLNRTIESKLVLVIIMNMHSLYLILSLISALKMMMMMLFYRMEIFSFSYKRCGMSKSRREPTLVQMFSLVGQLDHESRRMTVWIPTRLVVRSSFVARRPSPVARRLSPVGHG